ncbi:MAG: hypothetical protein IJ770_00580 [Alphaproteobacteria bacterium]|nr:hypothetical protein [Alphaproteobacteria bacterium]
MQKIILAIVSAMFVTFAANAQVFETDDGEPKMEVSPQAKQRQEEDKMLKELEKTGELQKLQEFSDSPFVQAEVNLNDENEEPEKVYDNSIGKIMEFKIVNGKVIYADPDDRKILIYTENFKVERGIDGMARCSMRIYVLNDLKERINTFAFKLIWPEISTAMQMKKVNPGVRTYNDIMLLGNGCFSMDKTPTIEVNRCRVKGKTQEQCANAVHWFKKDR